MHQDPQPDITERERVLETHISKYDVSIKSLPSYLRGSCGRRGGKSVKVSVQKKTGEHAL